MNILKPLSVVLLLACIARAAAAAAPEEGYQAALQCRSVHASEQSFADVYRLTLSETGPAPTSLPVRPNDGPIRVAASQAAEPAQFSIGAMPEPRLWLLLSGLAAVLWVARRRLDASF